MVIAVVAVGVMQAAIDDVVDVIAVGYGFVAATGTVDMAGLMAFAGLAGGAAVGVGLVDGQGVLVNVVTVWVVQVAVMHIVHVIAVADGRVAAAGAMGVIMVFVVGQFAVAHPGAPHVL